MNKGKYIIFNPYNKPLLFNEFFEHKDFKNQDEIKSAGFFWVSDDKNEPYGIKVTCYGESISLGVKSIPEDDAKDIKAMLLNIPKGIL